MLSRQAEPHVAAHAMPSAPVLERRRIVASKLAAPPLRPGIVARPALVEALVSATHAPVVLVSAPAGYGKTTLLALWNERAERPFAWISQLQRATAEGVPSTRTSSGAPRTTSSGWTASATGSG